MKLRAKYLAIETGGKPIVTVSKDDGDELGVLGGERVKLAYNGNEHTAIVNVVTRSVPPGILGITDDMWSAMRVKQGDPINITLSSVPESLEHIRAKLQGRKLVYQDIVEIVKDVVEGDLSEIEVAAFVTALHSQGGPSMDEAFALTAAMVNTGKRLVLDSKGPICDKHSVGGVPGDKTTMLVVPIVASLGLTIPKTSSRAITSAAGTADRVETLMPVSVDMDEMKRVVEKTNGCMVWGGSLSLAPADDIFIQAEFPLSIDPMLLPSIMSKKKAVGAQYLVVDIPTGRGTKMKTVEDADILGKEFIELGNRLNINTQCVLTFGMQPLGRCIGAGLEAREALEILTRTSRVPDVIDKAAHVAGTLLEMSGFKDGEQAARDAIRSGAAEKKMREIIYQQGGDSEVKPADIEIGQYGYEVKSDKDGMVQFINNHPLVAAARAAGSPKDKTAGIILNKKLGDSVKKGDLLFTVYSDKAAKLREAEKVISEENIYGIAARAEMMIHKLKEIPTTKPPFILER